MKKLFSGIVCAAMCGAAVLGTLGLAACGENGDENKDNGKDVPIPVSVYAPDGAPALALAGLIDGEKTPSSRYRFDVHIVNAENPPIVTYVTGNSPAADFCVLPSNAAAKVLGTGETYQMLGTVTNGNLYFLTDTAKNLPELTKENLSTALLGKTLGVIQYENVPGLTLRVVLGEYNIPYQLVENNEDPDPTKVNLRSLTPAQVLPATGCDYYLCPEPARTSKIGATKDTQNPFRAAGSLQSLYGDGSGFPQAVLVAKKDILSSEKGAVDKILSYMENSENYLKTADAHTLAELLASKRTEGMEAAFQEAQLNPTVLANCSVKFTKAADCKTKVIEFLTKYKAVSDAATNVPADAFFYAG